MRHSAAVEYFKRALVSATLLLILFPVINIAQAESRIVHGETAASGAWPFTVSILLKGTSQASIRHWCGGTLIGPDLVLTAAHCVPDPEQGINWINSLEVRLGSSELDAEHGLELSIVDILSHPAYDHNSFGGAPYDFALLRLERAVDLPTVTLAVSAEQQMIQPGKAAAIVGWGVTSQTTDAPENELREGLVELVDEATCKEKYGSSLDEVSMFCAGTLEIEKPVDTCFGDSGGPLLIQDGDEWIQLGVTSWGHGCAAPGYPGVYARVAAVLPWIEDNRNFSSRLPSILEEIDSLSIVAVRGARATSKSHIWSKSKYARKALQERLRTLKALRRSQGQHLHLHQPGISDTDLTQIARLAKRVSKGGNSKKQRRLQRTAVQNLHQLIEKGLRYGS